MMNTVMLPRLATVALRTRSWRPLYVPYICFPYDGGDEDDGSADLGLQKYDKVVLNGRLDNKRISESIDMSLQVDH